MRDFATRPGDHRFFSIMSILAAAVVVTGFSQTYPAMALRGGPGIPAIVHVHAAIFTCWLALFVAQTTLIGRGRVDLHRRIGVVGMVLATLMLIVGAATAIAVARLGHRGIPGVEFPDAAGFLLLNLESIVVFFALVLAGWYFRRSSPTHKRLMLMATVGGLMPPGIARLPLVSGHTPVIGATVMAFLLAGPAYDLVTRKRLHAAYGWSLLVAILAIPPLVGQVSATETWHRIASWLLQ